MKGIPDDKQQILGELSEHHQYRDHLSVVGDVVIYRDRLGNGHTCCIKKGGVGGTA